MKLKKAKYVSIVDLTWSYWQVPLTEETKPILGFQAQNAQFVWDRLPMGKLVCLRIRRISIRSPNPRRIDTNGGNPSNRWKSWFLESKGIGVSFTRLSENWIYFVEGNFIRIDSNEANTIIPIVNENLPGIPGIYGHLQYIHVMNGNHLIPRLKGDENLLHFRKGNSHAMCKCW